MERHWNFSRQRSVPHVYQSGPENSLRCLWKKVLTVDSLSCGEGRQERKRNDLHCLVCGRPLLEHSWLCERMLKAGLLHHTSRWSTTSPPSSPLSANILRQKLHIVTSYSGGIIARIGEDLERLVSLSASPADIAVYKPPIQGGMRHSFSLTIQQQTTWR